MSQGRKKNDFASTAPAGGAVGRRGAGVLLHVTSLPGRYGIGDFGPSAYAWIDALARARQSWWQILPLTPTGAGHSPYQGFSAFAGNAHLITPDLLVRDGLLQRADVAGADFPAGRVDYDRVVDFKRRLLDRAWERFQGGAARPLRAPFEQFTSNESDWLDDYALFMALKDAHPGVAWNDWPVELVRRRAPALREARRKLHSAIDRVRFAQFLFFRQWDALRAYAGAHGVRILGDLPIYVSPDSADVWASPNQFLLDAKRRPIAVAGVPPDAFSETGQHWGNPLYHWRAMARDGFAWWVRRARAALRQADVVRIDHFRGFAAYWEIPASAPTAVTGRWVRAPGAKLFAVLQQKLGSLPFVAEDLGMITADVEALRDRFALPGMRVLQFAFDGSDTGTNPYLPHNYTRRTIAYTGTHDNDTTAGWFAALTKQQRAHVRRYLPHVDKDPAWEMMRLAWSSVADLAIAPLQDVLSLGSHARMNQPGTPTGNWGWRFEKSTLKNAPLDRLADLTLACGRRSIETVSQT